MADRRLIRRRQKFDQLSGGDLGLFESRAGPEERKSVVADAGDLSVCPEKKVGDVNGLA